jgi:hypothetical protein
MYINKLDDGTINLTAPVLIPNAKDCDYHNGETPLTAPQIQAFKESYDKYGFVDHEHGLTRDGRKIGEPSNSIILDQDTTFTLYDGTTQTYPNGTWMLTTHITDEEAISEAMKGYYTGYSPSILPKASADKYLEALKSKGSCSCKNISSMGNSLIKDVPDPVVLSVSLTKQPCLHESKFCELNGEIMEDEVSLKSKILTAIGMTEEAEVLALKAEIKDLDAKIEAMQNEFNKSLQALQEDFKQILTDALKPVEEEPAEEEAEPEKEEVAEKAETESTEEAEVEVEEEVEEVEADKAEEIVEEEPVAEKGESKQEPVHDNLEAQKSKPKSVYELMGRYPNGVKIRR